MDEKLVEEVLTAIRTDKKIGRGSCSSVDEAMTDNEVRDEIRRSDKRTVKGIVAEFKKMEKIRNDYADDIRAEAF